ncbi:hypothetical protein NLJ89_g4145 [Agrocybe chaxingu]|uniref:Uncharacterized protein n=1 Tax=Agrocybe chaxingu TaxID=84603 RepID=A0A9W8KA36_9AGAR|nr:hypothetical protein NLJ89_g4145 [Agrocybe chaxingu]
MHRVGTSCVRVLRASAPTGARFNSTDAAKPLPIRRRVPLERLGDIVIPSAQEIRSLRTRQYKADISYLKNAPARSLAGRLTQFGAGKDAQSSEPDQQAPKTLKAPPQAITISQERVAALTAKRREARLSRQAGQSRITPRAPRKAAQPGITNESTLESASVVAEERLKSALASAAKRREDRLRREKRQQQGASSSKQLTRRPNPVGTTAVQVNDDFDDNLIAPNESDKPDYLPEFLGPEPISPHLLETLDFTVKPRTVDLVAKGGEIILPSYRASPFLGGDYAPYIGLKQEDYSRSLEELGAVKLAQFTLAHQPDVSIQQRKHALDIVSQSVSPAARQVAKAS